MRRISSSIGLLVMMTYFTTILFMGNPLLAQTDRGGIRGTITDASGGTVPGANVTAINIATGVPSRTTTTNAGIFDIQGLASGAYRIEVEHAGFKKSVLVNIVVDIGGTTGVDVVLQIGATAQTLEVTSAAPILKTESGDSSTTLPQVVFAELPVSSAGGSRNPITLMGLVPGVVGATSGGNSFGISVNGGQQFGTEFQVDGISNYMAELSGDPRNLTFTPDMVQEQSLVSGAYSAEFGSTSGGIQRYEIKSGTNQLHGSVSDYLKNTALDARGFYNPSVPTDHQNEIGFTIGGPVVIPKLFNGRNKAFFFFGYDHWHAPISGNTQILSVPTAAMKNGDFSQQLGPATGLINPCDGTPILTGQIFDPSTTTTANGQDCRTAFPGNRISSTAFSSQGQALLAFFPDPNLGDGYLNNYRGTVANSSSQDTEYIAKGDVNFGSKHRLSLMYGHSSAPIFSPNYFPDPVGQGTPSAFSVDLARVTENWSISPNLMNQLKLGFNHQYQFFGATPAEGAGTDWYKKLGIPGYTNALENFPNTTFGPYGEPAAGSVDAFGRGFAVNADGTQGHQSLTYVLSDTLYWTNGRHNLKFGIEYRDIRHGLINDLGSVFAFARGESGALLSKTIASLSSGDCKERL